MKIKCVILQWAYYFLSWLLKCNQHKVTIKTEYLKQGRLDIFQRACGVLAYAANVNYDILYDLVLDTLEPKVENLEEDVVKNLGNIYCDYDEVVIKYCGNMKVKVEGRNE